ncbi:MAG TPA: PDZ domain-containing protein [Rheinheimera sp.]|uniref:M61 family metallopeptidase n=1 Tax=Rheinheimera sp. TaxID=1869214 RepID=UPI002B4627CD|nr:PDZ domain-containing protein [Rheinheimera sp.]HJS13718.1 PDZ domain-containing protein [Rheinheimera sp.]
MSSSAYSWAQVNYQISITEPAHHLAQVRAEFQVNEAKPLTLMLPAWRSGKYQILDLAKGVTGFSAVDAQGKAIQWQKTEKSSWTLEPTTAGKVVVQYTVYANELGERTRHIDETHAYINSSAFLMFSHQQKSEAVSVQLNVPQGWRSFSGMAKGSNEHQFVAANYDVLADSPIETGINQHLTFSADGRDYDLVIWGEGNYNAAQMQKDLEKLVQQTDAIWQGYPYQRYLFIVHATDGARGATEHLNSTVIQRDRFTFGKREDYLAFLSTASHELVHTWNVKAYRPAELVPYDYLNPNYSKLLWISEGSTSYFQNQLLLRAGLMTKEEFYADLAKRLDKFVHTPGRLVQSVSESSFDSWISLGGDHGTNFGVNIYSEGYIASWLMDELILKQSGRKASYRELHNQLYQRFGKTTAFTAKDVIDIASELTGEDQNPWWQQQVEKPLNFDIEQLLASFGLQWQQDKKREIFSGVTAENKAGFALVKKVERDSPAWKAGFTSEDLIVAVNGLQLKADLAERLKDFKAGDKVQISYFRQGRLQHQPLVLADEAKGTGKLVPVAKPSRQQKAMHQAWLGVDL